MKICDCGTILATSERGIPEPLDECPNPECGEDKMRKLFILDHVYHLREKDFRALEDMLYICDEHEGYHIRPDTHETHMWLGEILTKAIVQGNFQEALDA